MRIVSRMANIRSASPGDAEAISALLEELGYSASPAETRHRLAVLCADPDQAIIVAEVESVVGWIHASRSLTLESGVGCEIRGLVVTASHRQSGVGRRMVEAAQSWAVGRHCTRIRARSSVVRDGAHAFYSRLGYRVSKTQRVFDRPLPAQTEKEGEVNR